MRRTDSLGRWISRLYRCGQRYFDAHLAPYGLGSGQVGFLMVLSRCDGLSAAAMAEALTLDRATAAESLARLEQAGYVRREPDPSDRRVKRVLLTDQGRAFVPRLHQLVDGWTAALTEGLDDEERAAAVALLQRMAANAEEAVDLGNQLETSRAG